MSSFSSSYSSRSSHSEKDRYKALLNVCKFQYLDFNCKKDKGFPHSSLSRAMFKTLIEEQNIKLPSFSDFKTGKTIRYDSKCFSTSDRTVDPNSTMLFAGTSDPIEQLQVKREAVDRFQLVKNNCENNKTISCDSTIDLNLLQVFGNEMSFDLPGFVVPASTSSHDLNQTLSSKVDQTRLEQSIEGQESDSIICVKDASFSALGLNKTVHLEDVNWHIKKVSDWRLQDGKNQYKVHYKSVKKRSYRP